MLNHASRCLGFPGNLSISVTQSFCLSLRLSLSLGVCLAASLGTEFAAADFEDNPRVFRGTLSGGLITERVPYVLNSSSDDPDATQVNPNVCLEVAYRNVELKCWPQGRVGPGVRLKIASSEGWGNTKMTLYPTLNLHDPTASRSDYHVFEDMDKREGSIVPGLQWDMSFGTFFVEGGLWVDLMGESGGLFADSIAGIRLDLGEVQVEFGGGFDYLSAGYTEYYYGVKASESSILRPEYTPKAAANTLIVSRIFFPFSNAYSLHTELRHVGLADSLTDSPLISTASETRFMLSFQYSLYLSHRDGK